MTGVTHCRAIGCGQRLLPFALFCDRCWGMLPPALKRPIEQHHRPPRRPSKVLQPYLDEAVRFLLYVKTEGHPPPLPASFEWDDPAPAPAGDQPPLKEDP